jgi:hypothetical protein
VDRNENNQIEFEEFIHLIALLRKVATADSAVEQKFIVYCQVKLSSLSSSSSSSSSSPPP